MENFFKLHMLLICFSSASCLCQEDDVLGLSLNSNLFLSWSHDDLTITLPWATVIHLLKCGTITRYFLCVYNLIFEYNHSRSGFMTFKVVVKEVAIRVHACWTFNSGPWWSSMLAWVTLNARIMLGTQQMDCFSLGHQRKSFAPMEC